MKRTMSVAVLIAFGLASVIFVSGSGADSQSQFKHHRVKVYFTREASLDGGCSRTKGYSRRSVGQDVLNDALNWLLKGPRASEKERGAASFFSARTAGMLNGVMIEDGTAYVDFDDFRRIIPDASSSCGSASLLAELDRTARQFPSVDEIVYSFEGSVEAFYEWLQIGSPSL